MVGASESGGRAGAARPLAPVLAEALGGAARRLRARLAARTGRDTAVSVEPAYTASLGELLEHLADANALWCVFSGPAAPAHAGGAPALVILEEALLTHLIGPLFGAEDDDRSFPRAPGATEVERAVGARLARELVTALSEGWAAGEAPRFVAGDSAPSPRVCEGFDRAAAYVVTRLEIGADAHGALLVALPAAIVPGVGAPASGAPVGAAPVGGKPGTGAPGMGAPGMGAPAVLTSAAEGGAAPGARVRGSSASGAVGRRPPAVKPVEARVPRYERLLPVELEVVVELARVTLPVRRLHGLAVGDEIPLGAVGTATGRVSDRPALVGEPGSRAGARSLRVLDRVDSSSSPGGGDR